MINAGTIHVWLSVVGPIEGIAAAGAGPSRDHLHVVRPVIIGSIYSASRDVLRPLIRARHPQVTVAL